MNSRELQFLPMDCLMVGVRGVPLELIAFLTLCRRYEGRVVFREQDVLVIEIVGEPALLDDLLTRLPRAGLTHLWRRGPVGPASAQSCGPSP